MSNISKFMDDHFRHFNARETVAAAQAYKDQLASGNKMMVSLAGAMSTGEIGRSLAEMIRQDKVHAISCTAANLEEDIFNLMAHDEYKIVPNWRALSTEDEVELLNQGFNRVTDTCIPETVMRNIEGRMLTLWKDAADNDRPRFPYEFMYELLDDPTLEPLFQIPKENSWMLAAKEKGLPIFVPGIEDSTLGNIFAARVTQGIVSSHRAMRSGTEQMSKLIGWYQEQTNSGAEIGFFQVGGGIAGDFAICVVPTMIQDLKLDIPLWSYFCQISDAVTSYGGYSGAVPNEKITWCKLSGEAPKFMIQSDASIVAPLMFAYILGW
ncbi:deoxyhypusine synthase family protein [Rosistilla oblonga]|uniref:Putative deoxyhypusine synthase n=1 Tax=Rosistilla oblonga TaxID=2527990 RepID=A0A518IWY1_9BACT|nr:deoxyhypusine synthase family protein [Rosistilla oblonga]QDV57600.1 putative deoxyhypusine synthase [Rosistilla oblonga]